MIMEVIMSYFLGIDYGTGGAKACITDEEMNVKENSVKKMIDYQHENG